MPEKFACKYCKKEFDTLFQKRGHENGKHIAPRNRRRAAKLAKLNGNGHVKEETNGHAKEQPKPKLKKDLTRLDLISIITMKIKAFEDVIDMLENF